MAAAVWKSTFAVFSRLLRHCVTFHSNELRKIIDEFTE